MPHEASRLSIKVKNVRIERLRDITLHPGDFRAEGTPDTGYMLPGEEKGERHKLFELSVTCRFRELWNQLNAKRGYSWDSNPWVWVYEFIRVKP
jgi:hypothetical protein